MVAMKKEHLDQVLNLIKFAAGSESKIGKAIAVAQIGMETYKNASKAFQIASVLASNPATAVLAPNAYFQASLIVANGALEAANAAGVKFFAEGTNDSPYTGKAIVDEIGAEIHTDAYGKIKSFGSDSGAHLTDIVKGDKIIPADISAIIKQTMFSSYGMKVQPNQTIDYDKIEKSFSNSLTKVVNAVKNKREASLSVVVQKGISDRVIFRGKSV
jgi:hypothetical protein